jgi:hypothetical protein
VPVIPLGGANQSLGYYENLFTTKYGPSAGAGYVAYAEANPGLTPEQAANNYLETILVKGLDTGLATGVGGAGTALGQIPGAAAKGASTVYQNLNPAQWLNKIGNFLSSRGTWVRIAEGVLGLALVLVAVGELGKGTAVGNIVKKVPFI